MARTISKHLAASMRARILTIVGGPRGGDGVATIRLSGRASPRDEAAGTTTLESRISHSRNREDLWLGGRRAIPGRLKPYFARTCGQHKRLTTTESIMSLFVMREAF